MRLSLCNRKNKPQHKLQWIAVFLQCVLFIVCFVRSSTVRHKSIREIELIQIKIKRQTPCLPRNDAVFFRVFWWGGESILRTYSALCALLVGSIVEIYSWGLTRERVKFLVSFTFRRKKEKQAFQPVFLFVKCASNNNCKKLILDMLRRLKCLKGCLLKYLFRLSLLNLMNTTIP